MADAPQRIGPYTLFEEIGHGGFSKVYRAQSDAGSVALKVLTGSHPDDDLRRRLKREAAILETLNSPHIVGVIDCQPEHDPPYIAFEYLNGTTFDRVIKQGPHQESFVRDVLVQALIGLRDAHAVGVIHRDIKPSNLMLVPEGQTARVVLLDFGIAKPRFEEKGMTRDGFVVGTPQYMAPEQLTQDAADASTDLYSLGLVMYELLTQVPAFDLEDTHQIVNAQLTGPIVKLPASLRIEQDLRIAINKLCNRERAVRYPSAHDTLLALGQSHRPAAPAPAIELDRPNPIARENPATELVEKPEVPPLREIRRSGSSPLLMLIGVLALVGVGYLVFNAYKDYEVAKTRKEVVEHKQEIEQLHQKSEIDEEEYDALEQEIAEEEARLEKKRRKGKRRPKVEKIERRKTFRDTQLERR